jgi:hypothetical protein
MRATDNRLLVDGYGALLIRLNNQRASALRLSTTIKNSFVKN